MRVTRTSAHGALCLVALTQWESAQVRTRLRREFYLLKFPEWARLPLNSAERKRLGETYVFHDSVVAMYGWMPLIDPLLRAKKEWAPAIITATQQKARELLDALIAMHRLDASQRNVRTALTDLDRIVPHRFVLPATVVKPTIPKGAGPPAWGTWQAQIHSLGQLLAWASADAVTSGAFQHLGSCLRCNTYYYSGRPTRHQFCSDTCRDLFHRQTAAERVRRHRASRKHHQKARSAASRHRKA